MLETLSWSSAHMGGVVEVSPGSPPRSALSSLTAAALLFSLLQVSLDAALATA